MKPQLTNQKVIELITLTYTSPNTSQIQEAYSILINHSFDAYTKSYAQLEDILTKRQYNLDMNCRVAIINLVKVQTLRMIEVLQRLNRVEDDVVTKNKRLLHAVQHILDNKQIESSIKSPIVQAYMELFNFFTPENYTRLISKSKFYFNTKQYFIALSLLETFLNQKTPLKHRFPCFLEILELIVSQSSKMVQTIIISNRPPQNFLLQTLNQFFEVLSNIWNQMTFQKFQKKLGELFLSKTFQQLLLNIQLKMFGNFWKKHIHHMLAITTNSLGRCNVFNSYPETVSIIRDMMNRQFDIFIHGGECQNETLMLIAAGIQYRLFEVSFSSYDLFGKLIYPNFLKISKYISNSADNLTQIINFLNDATFFMESQIPQVLSHKILYLLCKTFEQIGNSFKKLIYVFFLNFGNEEISQMIQKTINFQEGVDCWLKISQKITQDEQFEVILLYSALSANFFISEVDFLKKIEIFISFSEDYLLQNPNKKIVFYSLLLYKNYMDDIFHTNNESGFLAKTVLFSLSSSTDQILKEFSIEILKEKLSQMPSYQQFSRQIDLILKQMIRQYQQSLIPIVTTIFKDFGQYINHEDAIAIIKQTLSNSKEKSNFQNDKSEHLELLKAFLHIQSCKEYFTVFIEQLLQIANQNRRLVQKYINQFLDLIAKGIQICDRLPQHLQQTIMKFEITVNNVSIMQTVNRLIAYSSNGYFFNWLAVVLTKNDMSIYEILLIHNLIFYGHKFLTYESIKLLIQSAYFQRMTRPTQFNYRNGKLCLVFLFLLKYNWKQTNQLLRNQNWSFVIEKTKNMLKALRVFGDCEEIGRKPFIEEIYDLLYKAQNTYRWKYDIEMFLINQLDIFKYQLSDEYQLLYANLSFLACTMNILRAFSFIESQTTQNDSDSDESLHPHSKLEKQCRFTQQILKHFTVPPHLKEADYFTTFRKTVAHLKRDENSKKWIETLFKAVYREDDEVLLSQILKVEKNGNGNYRKITRVRRRQGQDDTPA